MPKSWQKQCLCIKYIDRYLMMKQGEVNKFETLNQLIGNIDVVFQFLIRIKIYLDLIWLLCNYYWKNHLLFCDKRDATSHKHLRVNRPSIFKSLSFKKIYLGISYYVNIEIHYHFKQTYYRNNYKLPCKAWITFDCTTTYDRLGRI